ncbi:ATP-binding protein [Mangrovicoccus algicola]|uniref:histidine kinase n=1 Tax=Mangrovicoccus algicola TaxID=2771008 RepID=A0A8J6YYX8_9RHOB|nr:ATP-binding protein [Mangrovicoccus algicola]MBE3639199.1 sodium:solute symporter [Mangrovicoccus algicola]
MSFDLLVSVSLVYVGFLFGIAYWAERRARRGGVRWLRSPLVYTLSLSIYCTAWTFYGAVGYASRSGLEFLTIYIGPSLVLFGWWWILRKLVRIGRSQRITSIADLISSRYGKSAMLGGIVTLIAVVGTTPYIALQLQSVTLSFGVFAEGAPGSFPVPDQRPTAIWVAGGMAVFAILFGTRNVDANERHHGVVTAIAAEALVKLFALLAVGIFIVWGVAGGIGPVAERIDASSLARIPLDRGRWLALIFVSGAALLVLPRMFQVLVVENEDERHLATASWAFPLYLALMSVFVIPIAAVGMSELPSWANPDLFVLTLPLAHGQDMLALLAFLGGFSSATSMVIVAAIALATMISNHIVLPLWLSLRKGAPGNLRLVLLSARRLAIAGVLGLGYVYYVWSGGGRELAAIGIISFVGVVQVMPAAVGGIFWRGATRRGAAAGVLLGAAVWAYTLFLPSFGHGVILPDRLFAQGPFGIGWLRPQALFGIEGLDPVVHAVIWSMAANCTAFLLGSITAFPAPLERLQGAQFVNVYDHSQGPRGWSQSRAEAEDLLIMAQRILGPRQAQDLFAGEARRQGKAGFLPDTSPDFLDRLERELAGSVGAATAHAMIGQIAIGTAVSVEDLMAVAGEAAQILEHSIQLQAKSDELSRTARQLREANRKLTELSVQKDSFLGQISHELRTPMTSIRSFSEILMDGEGMDPGARQRFAAIIHDEAERLTRLLDALLDLSVLEHGQAPLNCETVRLRDLIGRAVAATGSVGPGAGLAVRREILEEDVVLRTDADRLAQVFINIIANARKYCDADEPQLRIVVQRHGARLTVDFIDNGSGIRPRDQGVIFEKFSRLSDQSAAGSAGLGLAICREILQKLGGSIAYLPGQGGAAFRVTLPLDISACAA